MPRRLVAALAVVILLTISPMSLLPAAGPGAAVAAAAEPTIVDERSDGLHPAGRRLARRGPAATPTSTSGRPRVPGRTTPGGHLAGDPAHGGSLPRRGHRPRPAMPRPGRRATASPSPAGLVPHHRPVPRPGPWLSLGTYALGTSVVVRLSARTGDPPAAAAWWPMTRCASCPAIASPCRSSATSTSSPRARRRRALQPRCEGPLPRTEYREAGAGDWLLGASETSYDYADHRQVIEGLRPETRYELRVIATNAGGTTVSDIVPFRTDLRTVDCAAGEDLQAAIDKARSGDTLRIRGFCAAWGAITFGKDLDAEGRHGRRRKSVLRFGVGDVTVAFIDLRVQADQSLTNRGRVVLDGVDFNVLHLWNDDLARP